MKRITRKYIRKRKSYISKKKNILTKKGKKYNKRTKRKRIGGGPDTERRIQEKIDEEKRQNDVADEIEDFYKARTNIIFPHELEVGKIYNEIDCQFYNEKNKYKCNLANDKQTIIDKPLMYMGVYVVLDNETYPISYEANNYHFDDYYSDNHYINYNNEYNVRSKYFEDIKKNNENKRYITSSTLTTKNSNDPAPIVLNTNDEILKKKEDIDKEIAESDDTTFTVTKLYFESENGPVYILLDKIRTFVLNYKTVNIKVNPPKNLYINVMYGNVTIPDKRKRTTPPKRVIGYLWSIDNVNGTEEDKEFIDTIIKEKIKWPYNTKQPLDVYDDYPIGDVYKIIK